MEKNEKNSYILPIITSLIPFIFGYILWYNYNRTHLENLTKNAIPPQEVIQNTTPVEINIPNKGSEGIDIYKDFIRMQEKNSEKFIPNQQPSLKENYAENTNQMVEYMQKNALKITLTNPISSGYIRYKIKTPIGEEKGGRLFIYIYKDKLSGNIDLNTAKYSNYNAENGILELIFDIKEIGFTPYATEKKMAGKKMIDLKKYFSYFGVSDYISSFWINQNNSTIEEIEFVYE